MKELTCCDIMPGQYLIDENGQIFSKYKNKYMKQSLTPDGYCKITLRNSKHQRITKLVHQLVLLTFGEKPDDDIQDVTVDHIDGNRTNNNINNLRWLSRKENSSFKHDVAKGTKNGRNKLSLQEMDSLIDMLNKGASLRQTALVFNINPTTVKDIQRQKIWKRYTEGKLQC